MLISLLYYRCNSESDSYLHPHILPRNGDKNTASKGPLCPLEKLSQWVSNYLRSIEKLGIRHSLDLRL